MASFYFSTFTKTNYMSKKNNNKNNGSKSTAVRPKKISTGFLWSMRIRENSDNGEPDSMENQTGGTFTSHEEAAEYLNQKFDTDITPYTAAALKAIHDREVYTAYTTTLQSRTKTKGLCKITLWSEDQVNLHKHGKPSPRFANKQLT